LTIESLQQIKKIVVDGANVLYTDGVMQDFFFPAGIPWERLPFLKLGKGSIGFWPYRYGIFGFEPDFISTNDKGMWAWVGGIAWTHRSGDGVDIYFVSNQKDSARIVNLSLRVNGKIPEIGIQ
jgi:hypothetical protein